MEQKVYEKRLKDVVAKGGELLNRINPLNKKSPIYDVFIKAADDFIDMMKKLL